MPADVRLSKRAGLINDRLQVLNRLTNESVALLDVLGSSLSELGRITAPIHSRATALTSAQRNVAAAKDAVDSLLQHLDTSRRVQPVLEAGPVRDLDAFLDGLQQLEASNEFLTQHGDLAAARGALEHSQAVFNRALEACDADFKASLAAGSRSSSPPATWLASAREAFAKGADPAAAALRDLVPPALLPKLRRMVELMLGAGFDPAQTGYVAVRRGAIQQVLAEARLEPPLPGQLAGLPPDQLERGMAAWGAATTSLALLLLSERHLAEELWPPLLARRLFVLLAQPFLAALLASGHEVLEVRKGPDKLFALLDMHAQLALSLPLLHQLLATPPPPPAQQQPQLSPRLGALTRRPSTPGSTTSSALTGPFFGGGGGGLDSGRSAPPSPLRGAAAGAAAGAGDGAGGGGGEGGGVGAAFQPRGPADDLLDQLAGLLRSIGSSCQVLFGEYGEGVAREGSKVLPMDGTVHPLTAQVLSYVKRLLSQGCTARVLYGKSSTSPFVAPGSRPASRQKRGRRISQPGSPSYKSPADEDYSSSDEAEEEEGREEGLPQGWRAQQQQQQQRLDGAGGDDGDFYEPGMMPGGGGGGSGAASVPGGGQAGDSSRPRRPTKAQAALAAGIERLFGRLLENLEAKARGYRSESLGALFMMNNVHYLQAAVEGSPAALALLGVEWLERHKDVVEEWGATYHDATWMPLVELLRAEPPSDPVRLKQVLKDTYNSFNAAIDSIYTSQSGWTIPDAMLRGAVKRVIKDDLLGTYQDFLRRHADVDFTTNPAKYIKYSAADVASIIDDDLFETKAVSLTHGKLRDLHKEKLGAIV